VPSGPTLGASPRACRRRAGLVGLFFGLRASSSAVFSAVAGELSARRSLQQAGRAGLGATLGLALGLAAKVALAGSMLAVFAFDRFVWG
jgi:uncharacterized protein YqgC (DUF456 family)